jgi:glycosyltransferase involved in cell wall biosynthesis
VVLAVSRAAADAHAKVGWLRDRIRVLHNPVERATREHRPPCTTRDLLVFGYLGRLTVEKGVRTLVRAFATSAIREARLEIAGAGPLVHDLSRDAPERVRLIGWLDADAKSRWLDAIDCLVVPSEWRDPAPLVIHEARARGVPVIGARVGGIPELIAPECAPLMFAPGDADQLATRLREFADQPATYRSGASHGDAVALDWDQHVDAVLCAYRDGYRARAARSRSVTAVAP